MPQFVGPNPYWAEYKQREQALQQVQKQMQQQRHKEQLRQDITLLGQALTPQDSSLVEKRLQGAAQTSAVAEPTKQTAATGGQPGLTTQLANNLDEFQTLEGLQMAGKAIQSARTQQMKTKRAVAEARMEKRSGSNIKTWVRATLPNGNTLQLPIPDNYRKAARLMSKLPEATTFKKGLTPDEEDQTYRKITIYGPNGEPVPYDVPEGPEGNKIVRELYNSDKWSFSDPTKSKNTVQKLKRTLEAIQGKWENIDPEFTGIDYSNFSQMSRPQKKQQVNTLIEYLQQKADEGNTMAQVDLRRIKELEEKLMEVVGVTVPDETLTQNPPPPPQTKEGEQGEGQKILKYRNGKLIDPQKNETVRTVPDYTFTPEE